MSDTDTLRAYRDELLPLCTVITPNHHEARALLGETGADDRDELPTLGNRLRAMGVNAVCITGGDNADVDGRVLDWAGQRPCHRLVGIAAHFPPQTITAPVAHLPAASPPPCRWALSRPMPAVLAKMATTHALTHGHAAGAGAGPVKAGSGFAVDPSLLPWLSWNEVAEFAAQRPGKARRLGLYALVDSAERARHVLAIGVRTLQLRIKAPANPDAAWHGGIAGRRWGAASRRVR